MYSDDDDGHVYHQVIAAEGEQKASKALKEAADVLQQSPSALQVLVLVLVLVSVLVLVLVSVSVSVSVSVKIVVLFVAIVAKFIKCNFSAALLADLEFHISR